MNSKLKIYLVILVGLLLFLLHFFLNRYFRNVYGPGFEEIDYINNIISDGDTIICSFLTLGHIKNANMKKEILNNTSLEGIDYNMFCDLFLESIPKIKTLNYDFLCITGDVIPLYTVNPFKVETRNYEKERKVFEYVWDRSLEDLKKIKPNIIIAPGNHDYYNETGIQVFHEKVGEPYYSFAYRNIRFIILNSSKVESGEYEDEVWYESAPITPEQIQFLNEGFNGTWDEDNIFIFIQHFPELISNWDQEILPMLVTSNCKAVFSGTRFGTMGFKNVRNIYYFDSGFDHQNNYPSYYILTSVYENNNIKFKIFCEAPDVYIVYFKKLVVYAKKIIRKILY